MYKLPTTLRSKLREPLGKIISETDLSGNLDKATKCIVVGDESAITLHKFKYNIKLAIVDFQTQRRNDAKLKEEVQKIGTKVLRVINPAGTITDALWTAIDLGLKSPESVRIEVDGEEDLAFIPCMLLAPDDAIVIYGYPGRGLVLAEVNPKNRKEASDALESMVKEEE